VIGRPRDSLRLLIVAIVVAAALGSVAALVALTLKKRPALFANAEDPQLVVRGAALYAERCATCHGGSLEGQNNWQTVGANGRLRAPPQDEHGHSWMHSDEELFRIVKFSVRDTAAPGYVSDMPDFDGVLSDADVLATLAYIKSRWPIGVRVYQAALNPQALGMPSGASGVDWKLPKDCGLEPVRIAKPRQ